MTPLRRHFLTKKTVNNFIDRPEEKICMIYGKENQARTMLEKKVIFDLTRVGNSHGNMAISLILCWSSLVGMLENYKIITHIWWEIKS
jgi:hypothetical protein